MVLQMFSKSLYLSKNAIKGTQGYLAFDQKSVFITEFERAEVALVVLALKQAGLVSRQETPALRSHRHGRHTGASSWNTETIRFCSGSWHQK